MTSVTGSARAQQVLDLMLELGELVAVKDPETGETYYMATQALWDLVDAGGVVDSVGPHRPRHARGTQRRGWRIRCAGVVIASGIALSAVVPTAVSMSVRPVVHSRIIDDSEGRDEPYGDGPAQPTTAAGNRQVAAKPQPRQVTTTKRERLSDLFTRGQGKHRAGHNPKGRSNWRFEAGDRTSGSHPYAQVTASPRWAAWSLGRERDVAHRAWELTTG